MKKINNNKNKTNKSYKPKSTANRNRSLVTVPPDNQSRRGSYTQFNEVSIPIPDVKVHTFPWKSDIYAISGANRSMAEYRPSYPPDMEYYILSNPPPGIKLFTDYYQEGLLEKVTLEITASNRTEKDVNFFVHLGNMELSGELATHQDYMDMAANRNSTRIVTLSKFPNKAFRKYRFVPETLMPVGIYNFSETYACLNDAPSVSDIVISVIFFTTDPGDTMDVNVTIKINPTIRCFLPRPMNGAGPLDLEEQIVRLKRRIAMLEILARPVMTQAMKQRVLDVLATYKTYHPIRPRAYLMRKDVVYKKKLLQLTSPTGVEDSEDAAL